MTTRGAASEMAIMQGKLESLRNFLETDIGPVTSQEIRSEIGRIEEDLEKMERNYSTAAQIVSN